MSAKKRILHLALSGIIGLFLVACSDSSNDCNTCFPDFSECDCDLTFDPVCGVDGRNYLNDCYAKCLDVRIVTDTTCPPASFRAQDTMTWPIQSVCIPVIRPESAFEIRLFSDGTMLYQNQDGSYFRGTQNFCRCLPPETLIATPGVEKKVALLNEGEIVWTFKHDGSKLAAPLIAVNQVFVRYDHTVVRLILTDGRKLIVSPLHPDVNGRPLGELTIGDPLDGAFIRSTEFMPYRGGTTWDILPAGETGYYMADGVIIGSTLKRRDDW